jgi:hypothetical protein
MVTEEEARLVLLQSELTGIQESIRDLDKTMFQIKGWCVTTSLAIGGFAVAYHRPALLLIGCGSVIGFFLVNCQSKLIQRLFIDRNLELDTELKNIGIIQVLRGAGTFDIVGTSVPGFKDAHLGYGRRILHNMPQFWREAQMPGVFSLYLFILVCLILEAVILF